MKIVFVLAVILAVVLIASGVIFRQNYVPPIIMYHSVHSDAVEKSKLSVSLEAFRRQMRFLKENNYNVVSLEKLASMIKNSGRVPSRTVAITFDDGYGNFYTCAFPVLKKYGLPAAMFIITEEVERPQGDRLRWSQIREIVSSGLITIGSHCVGPEPLVNIASEDELKRQIFDSKRALEEQLGRRVTLFSYPEGRFNEQIRQLVIKAGYEAAVATNPGKAFANDDIFALKRLKVSPNCDNLFVFWAETSGYYNFIRENRHK